MTDEHLVNTVRMFIRKAPSSLAAAQEAAFAATCDLHGDMASYYADQEWSNLLDMTLSDYLETVSPMFSKLVEEMDRRKLGVKPLPEPFGFTAKSGPRKLQTKPSGPAMLPLRSKRTPSNKKQRKGKRNGIHCENQ